MAHLLGSKFCIESLGSDVEDLQTTINEVFSRVGPVRFPSWKFPDKISCDIDIAELLGDYCYKEDDEEDCQVSHIMMFELVIDRVMLLLQSFTRFLDQLTTTGGSPPSGNESVGSQMSIGLATKRFWNKVIQVFTNYKQLQSENKSKNRTIAKLENVVTALDEENESLKPTDVRASRMFHLIGQEAVGQSVSLGLSGLIPPNKADDPFYQRPVQKPRDEIAKDVRTVPCQTLETAFVPCESCACVQLGLKEVSNVIIDVCRTQNLPCAVAKHKKQEHDSVMSATDVSRWVGEQGKDLARINKHLENLMKHIEPLKADLTASEEKCSKLEDKVAHSDKDIKKEKDKQSNLIRQHEVKLKEIEKTHCDSLAVVERTNNELKSGKKKAEEQVTNLRKELVKQKDALEELESSRKTLLKDLEEKTAVAEKVDKLEKCVQEMQTELESAQKQLDASGKILQKEQAKSRSVAKHEQAMQSKHEALIQRVDELDQECEELKERVVQLEDENEELQDAQEEVKKLKKSLERKRHVVNVFQFELVKQMTNEKNSLEFSIRDLQTMINNLEDDLKETKDRERLMVQYPDLNVGSLPPEATPESSGDIAVDMERQVQANNIRIQILEEHNSSLRQTLTKLKETSQPNTTQTYQNSGPVPLWKMDNSMPREDQYNRPPERHVEEKPQRLWSGHSQSSQQSQQHRDLYSYQSPPSDVNYSKVPRNSPTDNDMLGSSSGLPPKPPAYRDSSSAKSRTGDRTIPSTSVNVAKLAAQGNTSLSAYLKLKRSGGIANKGEGDTGKTRPRSGKSNIRDQSHSTGSTSSLSLRIDVPGSREGSSMGDRDTHISGKPKSRPGSWMAPLAGKKPDRPESDNYNPMSMFVCHVCDKMYTTKKDLDVHKSYCYG
ncbi:coiled-coil domain-containing protein 157-like [Ptychodera flava]|uniref:coiled-coil domain-containing protein 157-like n=1 Tax=Ptychodera flava TaxID=63121 RepID=UPI00396AA948